MSGETLAKAMTANCVAYQNLPRAVRAEFWRICAVLPGVIDAPLLLTACRPVARDCGLSVKSLYNRIRHFQSSQGSWLALIDRREAGPGVWRSAKKGHEISPSLAAALRKCRVRPNALTSLSEAEQHQLILQLTESKKTLRAVIEWVRRELGVRATVASLRRFKLRFAAGAMRLPEPTEIRIQVIGDAKVIVGRVKKNRK